MRYWGCMDALKRKMIVESQLVQTVKHYRLGHKFEAVGQKTDAKTTLNSSLQIRSDEGPTLKTTPYKLFTVVANPVANFHYQLSDTTKLFVILHHRRSNTVCLEPTLYSFNKRIR